MTRPRAFVLQNEIGKGFLVRAHSAIGVYEQTGILMSEWKLRQFEKKLKPQDRVLSCFILDKMGLKSNFNH